jgi:hypothetical protein
MTTTANRPSVSDRERQFLLLAKTGIVTVEIVHRRHFADQNLEAARSAIRRLVNRGHLQAEPLDERRVYYCLTRRGAHTLGVSSKCAQPLKKQGKVDRYAVSWFIHAERPGKRALFNPHDYPDQFPVAGQSLPRHHFYIDHNTQRPRLGIILVDHNAQERRIVQKTVKLLGRFLHQGWFDEFIRQEAFVVTVLTFSTYRKQAFEQHIPHAISEQLQYPLSRLRPDLTERIPIVVHVCVVPGLDTIVTHSPDEKGKP